MGLSHLDFTQILGSIDLWLNPTDAFPAKWGTNSHQPIASKDPIDPWQWGNWGLPHIPLLLQDWGRSSATCQALLTLGKRKRGISMPPSLLRHSASLIPVSGSTTYWTLLILPRETGAGPAFPEQRLDDQLPTWPTDPFLWGIRAPPASTKSEVEDYEDLCLALPSRGLERYCLLLWGGGCRRSAPCWALLKLWGQGFPTDVWLEQGEYRQKGFLLLGDPFLVFWLWEAGFSWDSLGLYLLEIPGWKLLWSPVRNI